MPDTWQGKTMTDANVVVTIHYRIHDAATGELLGFGSNGGDGSLEAAVRHFQEVQTKNPGRNVVIRPYDAPAYYVEQ